ncbi:helix-turn-helix domain-containing protein [Kitasatospora sp. A2-31]|uniref:nSTAND1 domain-containing NTPase n=1 Tax=Kitasatospora sp. A2-31 TaxID=2916414 RepID=UPI001EEB6267|nr:helix-turn-helix domain-containing protein [Kitasatospora sp. A2-31]MCG6494058.1 helix-turn-helix domain-containing protein [Kitasatospora sp. A2-31]
MSTESDTGQPGGAGFGTVLRTLRREAGLSQADLAGRVHYDKSHISKVETGDKPATAEFARACDRALRAGGSLVALATRGHCPYPGLASFRAEDERWFHGRERARAALLGLLAERHADRGGPVLVVGPSGAGKSSLLRAGLVPALRRGGLAGLGPASAAVLTPTGRPLDRLAELADGPDAVWIVDQAEELFTLCADPEQRRAFLDALCREAGPGGRRLVVLGLRADLYGHCLAHDGLLKAVRRGQLALGPMNAAELAEAITGPARTARLELEPGLLELMVTDLGLEGAGTTGTAGAYDPGALPLLAHTLRAVWQQRAGRSLTLAGYRAIGGLHGSVAATAERAWARLEDDAARATARRVLLRLVHLGPDGRASRRRADRAALAGRPVSDPGAPPGLDASAPGPGAPGPAPEDRVLDQVLASFADDRLLTVDATGVTLSHEALLRAWPRLRDWVDEGRAGLRLHQQLTQDAEHWAEAGREEALLYRGSRLELACERAAEPAGEELLTPVEREFLTAGAARAELEQRAERRRVRTLRQLVAGLALLLVAALLAGGFAWQQWDRATGANRTNLARALLSGAERNAGRDPYAAMLESVEARRVTLSGGTGLRRPAEDAVLSTQSQQLTGRIPGFTLGVNGLAISPDGRLVATGDSQGQVALWDAHTTARVAELQGHDVRAPVQDVRFSPDGSLLAATVTRKEGLRILLWRVADRQRLPSPVMPQSLPTGTSAAKRLAFSRDGALLAAASSDAAPPGRGCVWVWRTDAGAAPPVRTLTGHTGVVQGVAFGPGHLLASASTDGDVLVRDLGEVGGVRDADPSRAPEGGATTVFAGRAPAPKSVAFAADGRLLAVGGDRGHIRLWRPPADGGPVPGAAPVPGTTAPPGPASSAPASSAPQAGASGADGDEPQTSPPIHRLTGPVADHPAEWPSTDLPPAHQGPVNALALTPDGTTLLSAGADQTTRVWDLPTGRVAVELRGHPTFVLNVAVAGDNRTVVTSAGISSPPGSVLLWDLHRGTDLAPGPDRPAVTAVASAGDRAAVGTADGRIALWDVGGPVPRPVAVAPPDGRRVTALAFDRRGRTLATAHEGGAVRFLRVVDGTPVAAVDVGGSPTALALSPDGTVLAVGTADGRLFTGAPDGTPLHARPLDPCGPVYAAVFLGDGADLAFACDSQYVHLLAAADPDARPRKSDIHHADHLRHLAVSPDGRLLATAGNDRLVVVWDVRTGRPLGADPNRAAEPEAAARTVGSDTVHALAFAPDGRTLADVGHQGALRLWDLDSPAPAATLTGPGLPLNGLAFLPDGRVLTGGDSGAAPVWSLDPATAAAEACSVVRPPLPHRDWLRLAAGAPYRPTCP